MQPMPIDGHAAFKLSLGSHFAEQAYDEIVVRQIAIERLTPPPGYRIPPDDLAKIKQYRAEIAERWTIINDWQRLKQRRQELRELEHLAYEQAFHALRERIACERIVAETDDADALRFMSKEGRWPHQRALAAAKLETLTRGTVAA